jgi:NADPH:quinone reductase-like Zn-dependent oxidoreductase
MVPELVGTTTLKDSLHCARQGGIVCMTGIVGNKWSFDDFAPMDAIPTAVFAEPSTPKNQKTSCGCLSNSLLSRSRQAASNVQIGKTFQLDQILEAHHAMEENKVGGKIVVLP